MFPNLIDLAKQTSRHSFVSISFLLIVSALSLAAALYQQPLEFPRSLLDRNTHLDRGQELPSYGDWV